ncbi:MAG: hypothetical protein Q9196_004016 [Gyalolechia fulgens]
MAMSDAGDELDDMVYVSGREDNDDSSKKPLEDAEPGMIPAVKNLYAGRHGLFTTTNKLPEHLPEPEETKENRRYALLICNMKCYDDRKSYSIASIVIQSPLLRKVLCWVLKDYPGIAPHLGRMEAAPPFRPFVHRWQRLTDALNNERDLETKSHIRLFYDVLRPELEFTLGVRDDFLEHKAVNFNNLWMLFEPGDIIYTIYNTRPIAAKLRADTVVLAGRIDHYRLVCETISGDGNVFGWRDVHFEIPRFDGMMKITNLGVYPLKYHQKPDEVRQQLIDNGKAYERLMGFHHMQYQGTALDGGQTCYVDSRIIVDPDVYKYYEPDATHSNKENLKDQDGSSDDNAEAEEMVPALTDDQLLLCDSSIRGYSLRNKRWLDFFVDNIEDIHWDEGAWDNVVLDSELKDLIFSLTDGHLWNQEGLQSKGLNILLSGPTGSGKTFTVESVAEALRAPLFHVTLADVDLSPEIPDLESPFTRILTMCGRWNAILVFDQTQGALSGDQLYGDQGRAYSLLLNALDSHSATFFVTCDAVAKECMDERLRSRFHVCLQLPDPTPATREEMWRKCFESQKDCNFIVEFDVLADWMLNGREITNAVTAAKTLAMNGVIEMKHLERVVSNGKKPVSISDDDHWICPPKVVKKKSKHRAVDIHVDCFREPPKDGDDIWGTSKLDSKKSKIISHTEPTVFPSPSTSKESCPFRPSDPKVVGFPGSSNRDKTEKGPKEWSKEFKEEQLQPSEDDDRERGIFEAIAESNARPPPPCSPPMEYTDAVQHPINEEGHWSFGRINKKKSAVDAEGQQALTVIEEPPKDNEDDWGTWGFGTKNKKKPKKKGRAETAVMEPPPTPEKPGISEDEALKAYEEPPKNNEDDWGPWGFGAKNKKNPKKKGRVETVVMEPPPTPEKPGLSEDEALKANEEPPKHNEDDWGLWGFGTKDKKKPKKKGRVETAVVEPPAVPEEPDSLSREVVEAVPAVDWGSWGSFASRPKKKKGKGSKISSVVYTGKEDEAEAKLAEHDTIEVPESRKPSMEWPRSRIGWEAPANSRYDEDGRRSCNGKEDKKKESYC